MKTCRWYLREAWLTCECHVMMAPVWKGLCCTETQKIQPYYISICEACRSIKCTFCSSAAPPHGGAVASWLKPVGLCPWCWCTRLTTTSIQHLYIYIYFPLWHTFIQKTAESLPRKETRWCFKKPKIRDKKEEEAVTLCFFLSVCCDCIHCVTVVPLCGSISAF